MVMLKLSKRIEAEFDRCDAEENKGETQILHALEGLGAEARKTEEEILLRHNFEETRKNFDTLLDILDKDHVTDKNGDHVNSEDQETVVDLSVKIYQKAMTSLHLSRGLLKFISPELTDKLNDTKQDISDYLSLAQLKRKVDAHFILGELYAATGVRMDPKRADRSARVEYEKVIQEGEDLFKKLGKAESDEERMFRARLAYKIGASYKRLYDLFVNTSNGDGKESLYGLCPEKKTRHDYFKKARHWFHTLNDEKLEVGETEMRLFATNYEFRRYLRDCSELGVACVFIKLKGLAFNCSKIVGEQCGYMLSEEKERLCTYGDKEMGERECQAHRFRVYMKLGLDLNELKFEVPRS
jgi:hypothetical protein